MTTMHLPDQEPFPVPTTDRIVVALFLATALHALLILGVSFDIFDTSDDEQNMPTLDITVVNRQMTKPPKDYDYLAETSQEGAGNTREKVQPRQATIKQIPPATTSPERASAKTQVLTRKHSRQLIPKAGKSRSRSRTKQTRSRELIDRSMEMLILNRQINQTMQAFSRTPKSKFISARTREFKYASYMRDWVSKVERVGDLNYPDAARRRNLSGKLIVQVAVYPDGSVREITIRKPSGYKILDDAAVRIVKLAAPFAPFPDDIKKETDVLYITRTWVFTSGNHLQSH